MVKPQNGDMTQTEGLQDHVTLTFSCDETYQLIGQEKLLCLTNGEWTGTSPTCQAYECPHFNATRYGKVTVTGRSPGDTAQFTCDVDFNLVGPAVVQCNDTGHWNDTLPYCKAVPSARNCSDTSGLSPTGGAANLTCSPGTGGNAQVHNECSIQCQGNSTYQPKHFNRYVCDSGSLTPGWLVSTNTGNRPIELGTCEDPVYPLMTLFVEGLFAKVSVIARHADLYGCLRDILNTMCNSECEVSEVRLQVVIPGEHRQLVEIEFTLSQLRRTGGGSDKDKVQEEWQKALVKMNATLELLQNFIDAGNVSTCPNNASFAWQKDQLLRGTLELNCPKGHILDYPFCYPCPSGTFYDRDLGRCEPCAVGFYRESSSSGQCQPCPRGTTTVKEGTKSSAGCLALADCNCGQHACVLTPNGYTCQCEPGFTQEGPKHCADIDECEKHVCPGQSNCFNVPGSYLCVCEKGYAGPDCADIDECHFPDACPLGHTCVNTPGSYQCVCNPADGGTNCTGLP